MEIISPPPPPPKEMIHVLSPYFCNFPHHISLFTNAMISQIASHIHNALNDHSYLCNAKIVPNCNIMINNTINDHS